jgi:plastocyanin
MRVPLAVVLISLALTSSLSAKEVFLSVTGKANGFFSDVRIFNSSYTKDITVNAQYLPSGNSNNTSAAAVPLVIAKRSMKVYDDAVQSIFGRTSALELGAIRLVSDDDFVATQRVYADRRESYQRGTLGQFVQGQDVSQGLTKGVVLQLKSGQATLGNFRTNWGGMNPNTTVANVSFKLYDRDNQLLGTNNLTFQPYGVFSPGNIVNFFGISNENAPRLSDAWISFESDAPVFLYGSVVDNGADDQTFVAAVQDTGVAPSGPTVKTVTIAATAGDFNLNGPALTRGDQVRFIATGTEGIHGFRLFDPDGNIILTLDPLSTTPVERTITIEKTGGYPYICTRTTCSTEHSAMFGELQVN